MIPLPYDLAWDAVNAVVKENSYHVQAQDMTNGIIEVVGPRFTLHDADCGKVKSVAGAYIAEPEQNSSSVYNFLVRPRGPEATIVEVRATFNSSVSVPLHPATDVDCVSHGIQESNLLRQVLAQARKTHRPEYAQPSAAPQNAAAAANTQSSVPAQQTPIVDRPASRVARATGYVDFGARIFAGREFQTTGAPVAVNQQSFGLDIFFVRDETGAITSCAALRRPCHERSRRVHPHRTQN